MKKDTISKCKKRIQDLLKQIVRARDKVCFLKGKYQQCGGVLSADHIVSRTYSRTYGLAENVIGICMAHHLFWKPRNPTLYTNEIDRKIGREKRLWLEKESRKITQYTLKQWQKIENNLKKLLEELEK